MKHEQSKIMNKRRQNTIEQAITNLGNKLEDKLMFKKIVINNRNTLYDATFKIHLNKFFVKHKTEVRPDQIIKLQEFKGKYNNTLIIADYITPRAKVILREKNINYIDGAGNIYFRFNNINIYIEAYNNQPPLNKTNGAFTKTGLKVVYLFLNNPEFVNFTYRDIAKNADVALGTVPKVINGLEEENYLLFKKHNEFVLNNNDNLLKRWQFEYNNKLKPALLINKYKPINDDFYTKWKKLKLPNGDLWGGETAADILTNYLKPEIFTIYTFHTNMRIIRNYGLIPDNEGDVHVYNQFWNIGNDKVKNNCVPNIITYADLLGTGDTRCIETANKIYEQFL